MEFTTTQTVTLDESSLCTTVAELGEWMADCGINEWSQYDDEGTFKVERVTGTPGETRYVVSDPDEGKAVAFTATEFFRKHVELIWLATIDNYRHDWIEFAFRSKDADADEYDANTCDAVLQNMLYGEVVYG